MFTLMKPNKEELGFRFRREEFVRYDEKIPK